MGGRVLTHGLCGPCGACDFLPDVKSVGHLATVLVGGEQVASGTKVLGDGTIGRKETLRLAR